MQSNRWQNHIVRLHNNAHRSNNLKTILLKYSIIPGAARPVSTYPGRIALNVILFLFARLSNPNERTNPTQPNFDDQYNERFAVPYKLTSVGSVQCPFHYGLVIRDYFSGSIVTMVA